MKSLHDLLAQQEELEHRYPLFVPSLDTERTVTLRELLTCPESVHRLQAPWLDMSIVQARFGALGSFMERVGGSPRMRNCCRLIFFQAQPGDEDETHHQKLIAESKFYARHYGHLPPQFGYLHTPNRWLNMSGTLTSGNRRLKPMSNYSSHSYKEVMGEEPQTLEEAEAAADLAFGYAVPNWPEILQVRAATATDYFLRPVLHDIGHMLLPSLNPDIDSLHNAVMLYAMGRIESTHENVWETMVHSECTDPYFYVYGEHLLRQCKQLELNELQLYLVHKLERWYTGPTHERKKAWLWEIAPDISEPQAQAQMKLILEEMCSDGFKRYGLMP